MIQTEKIPRCLTHSKMIPTKDSSPIKEATLLPDKISSSLVDVNIIKSSIIQNIPINQTLILNNGKKSLKLLIQLIIQDVEFFVSINYAKANKTGFCHESRLNNLKGIKQVKW